MVHYIKYEEYKRNYHNTQETFNDLLNEQERLFSITQPQSTSYDKDKTNGGKISNAFDNYVIAKQESDIDRRLAEARSILKDRKLLLDSKEEELLKSKDWYDKIYVLRYINKKTIRQIEKEIPLSKSEIDRKIKKIAKSINLGQKGTKVVVK